MREIKPLVYLVGRFSRLQKGLCTVQSSVNFMFVITVWRKDHNNAAAGLKCSLRGGGEVFNTQLFKKKLLRVSFSNQ